MWLKPFLEDGVARTANDELDHDAGGFLWSSPPASERRRRRGRIPRSNYGRAHAKLNVAVLTFFPAPFVALAEKSPETLVNFMSDGQSAMK